MKCTNRKPPTIGLMPINAARSMASQIGKRAMRNGNSTKKKTRNVSKSTSFHPLGRVRKYFGTTPIAANPRAAPRNGNVELIESIVAAVRKLPPRGVSHAVHDIRRTVHHFVLIRQLVASVSAPQPATGPCVPITINGPPYPIATAPYITRTTPVVNVANAP